MESEVIFKFEKKATAFNRSKVDAQQVGEELTKLAGAEKKLTTEDVVEAARTPASAMYGAFDWDNRVAGENWRKHQARNLIAAVVIVSETDHAEPRRAFVNVQYGVEDSYYRDTVAAVTNSDEWDRVIRSAKQAIETAFDRLEQLERLANKQRQESLPFVGRSKRSLVEASNQLDAAQGGAA